MPHFHPHANLRIHLLRLGLSRNGVMAVLTSEEGTILASIALTPFTMANSTTKAHS
jgi:hypothetical protein